MRLTKDTVGERSHSNRVRSALITGYLTTSIVVGTAALMVPVDLVVSVVTGGGLITYAPILLPTGVLTGFAIIGYLLIEELLVHHPGLSLVADSSSLFKSYAGISMAAGLERPPALYVQEPGEPNAFAIGRSCESPYIVVTCALIDLLEPRELHGVLAHEIAHVRNEDVRLTGRAETFARVSSALRDALFAPTGFMDYREAAIKLVPLAIVIGLSLLDVHLMHVLNHGGKTLGFFTFVAFLAVGFGGLALVVLYFVALMFAGCALIFVAILLCVAAVLPLALLISTPLLAALAASQVSRIREYQADAEGASYTGEPLARSSALRKLSGTPQPELVSVLAGVKYALFTVPDIPAGMRSLLARMLATHPPIKRRIEALDRLAGIDTELANQAATRSQQ
jgi:heat shock protein HtpX